MNIVEGLYKAKDACGVVNAAGIEPIGPEVFAALDAAIDITEKALSLRDAVAIGELDVHYAEVGEHQDEEVQA